MNRKENLSHRSKLIKGHAKELGFLDCKIAKAQFLENEAPLLEQWLQNNQHGEMHYMANHFDKRLNPQKLVPGAKSVISLTFNYYTDKNQIDENAPKISKYAYGKDYHFVIKSKLKNLLQLINDKVGEVHGRVFVDSAPVLEKAWAVQSGIGWMGKHTNVLTKKEGSFYFLAEIILDLELEYDTPTTNHCGSCTACIDACPTEAIIAPYQLDANKCISYLTIELKNELPSSFQDKMGNWMFGCDVCQEVCPWNRFSKPHQEKEFEPHPNLLDMTATEWTELTAETFNEIFKKSAVKRAKFSGLKRNISFLKPKN